MIRDVHPRSRFLLIPDPGVRKAPDPGSTDPQNWYSPMRESVEWREKLRLAGKNSAPSCRLYPCNLTQPEKYNQISCVVDPEVLGLPRYGLVIICTNTDPSIITQNK